VLPDLDIKYFLQICEELGMTALIEVRCIVQFISSYLPINYKLASLMKKFNIILYSGNLLCMIDNSNFYASIST
jgi:hypothetical protein